MNVVFVIPYFYPAWQYGGQPRSAYELARALVHRGHHVKVLTTDSAGDSRLPSGRQVIDGIEVIYYRNLSNRLAFRQRIFWSPALFREVTHQLANADLLHIHELRSTLTVAAHRAAMSLKVPYVLSTHGGLRHLGRRGIKVVFDRLWGSRILADAASVIAISPIEDSEARSMGVAPSRIDALPNMIATQEYDSLPAPGTFRNRWKLGSQPIILFLGRLHWIKGADVLVEAFRELADSGARLIVAGPDDGQERELRQKVSLLGLQDRVSFPGYLDHEKKLEAFVDANVLVVPSRSEVFAITAIEALASGCPVLMSDVCGLHPKPGAAEGLLEFRNEDVPDLAARLRAALNDASLRESAACGRKFVELNFSAESISEKAERIYLKVTK